MLYTSELDNQQNGNCIEQETIRGNSPMQIGNRLEIFCTMLKFSLRLSNQTNSEMEPDQDSNQNSNPSQRYRKPHQQLD
ncbi:hypothetical protein scyTo_0017241 [Scyliorhinus torazame]|uniref:Uncharacterized protein n=1 Tax=Scyliorhinus torazame TaxID=75743 RepID=A0A401Q5G0_SCYTO|nr:hypothetical protein [Scyliorhinus torazame]